MRYDPIFRYNGWDRRVFKRWKGYMGLVNDHHVIPKQFRNHPVVKTTKFDINGNFNLVIMPTSHGITELNMDPKTIPHTNHPRYNHQVKCMLDHINLYYDDKQCKDYRLWLLVNWLKENGKYLMM